MNKSLQPRHPLHYVAIDLVDLQSLAGSNYKHKLIFTAVGLFSNYAGFYPMTHKDANETFSAFKKMLEHNLKLQTARVQERMRQKMCMIILLRCYQTRDQSFPNNLGFFCVRMGSKNCLLYTSPSPRDLSTSRMPSSA